LRTRLAFAEPIGRTEDVAAALDYLLVDMCARLQAAGLGARRLEFALYRTDGTLVRAAVGTSRPSRAPDHLRRLFREKLDGIDAGFGIEAATLDAPTVDPLSPAQAPLGLDGERPDAELRTEPLAQLVDRLANRLGPGAVVRLAPVASHIPERAWRTLSAMAEMPAAAALRSLRSHPHPPVAAATGPSLSRFAGEGDAPHLPLPLAGEGRCEGKSESENADSHRSRQPRPLQLLASPEPIEVIAPVPDGPPALFRRGRTLHRILRAQGPERIGCEWWLLADGHRADEAARVRDYWRVEDADGRRFWIFREGIHRPDRPPRWWLHGLFA
jgi:protein ImuB